MGPKQRLSRNCVSEMRPCSATDRQIGSNQVWKSNKTTEVFWKNAFRTNLEQKSKGTSTDLDTRQTTQQRQYAQCACQPFPISLVARLERFVSDELRTSQVCVLQSHRHRHGALHPSRTSWHSLDVRCSVWQRQGSA